MKVLCLGDSPYRKTGFGIVNEVATRHLLAEGHELIVLGAQDSHDRLPFGPRMTYITTHDGNARGDDDMMGFAKVESVIERYKPDAMHVIGDAATVATWLTKPGVASLPGMAYVPIEGEPMNLLWVEAFKTNPQLRLVTTTEYGRGVLRSHGLDGWVAYHGVSDDFVPLTPEKRAEWRYRLSWDDKFVVMCVAQNVGRKQWPRLFEAIGIAAKRVPNLMLYAHTVPFNGYWLDGWDLPQLATQMGVWERVIFPPTHERHNDAIGLTGDKEWPGLIDLYGASDLFVLPSQVEGWGLPISEAMKMGLPVAHTDYAAGAEVIGNAGILLPVSDWTYFRSHSRYANVAPRDIAEAIVKVAKSPEYARQLSRRALERAKAFTWDGYRAALTECFGAETQTSLTEVDLKLQAVG